MVLHVTQDGHQVSVNGDTGCNSYSGPVDTGDGGFVVGDLASSSVGCPGDLGDLRRSTTTPWVAWTTPTSPATDLC